MDTQVFVLFLQLLIIFAWFLPLIIPYWILKHWAEEKKRNDSGGKPGIERIGRLRPNES
ncbi:MAG: hypothetical protein ACI4XS_03810 [Bacillus sp. (in: firmicutes)]